MYLWLFETSLDICSYTVLAYSLSLPPEFCFSHLFKYLTRNVCGLKPYFWVTRHRLQVAHGILLAGLATRGTRFSAFHIFFWLTSSCSLYSLKIFDTKAELVKRYGQSLLKNLHVNVGDKSLTILSLCSAFIIQVESWWANHAQANHVSRTWVYRLHWNQLYTHFQLCKDTCRGK